MTPAGKTPGMTRKLLALSFSIALATSGIGMILPIVPFHIERVGLGGMPTALVAVHVSLLAASYALMQLGLAPVWGRLSDSLGRRPLLAIGLIGLAVGQALCGLVTSLAALYAVRLGTAIFSAAIIPAAFAFVADTTCDEDRTRGMAQLSAAAGIGFVIGPAFGGFLAGIKLPAIGLHFANYSLPFFAASGCALLALLTLRWLEEPVRAERRGPRPMAWTDLVRRIGLPLVVSMASQVAVALFETTFALHARTDLGMGLVEIGAVFMVCGLLMLVVQLGAVAALARRWGEARLASAALVVMGVSLAFLAGARSTATVFGLVALYAIGMGFLTPTMSSLVSRRGGLTRVRRWGSRAPRRASARSWGRFSAAFSSARLWPFRSGSPARCSSGSHRSSPGASSVADVRTTAKRSITLKQEEDENDATGTRGCTNEATRAWRSLCPLRHVACSAVR